MAAPFDPRADLSRPQELLPRFMSSGLGADIWPVERGPLEIQDEGHSFTAAFVESVAAASGEDEAARMVVAGAAQSLGLAAIVALGPDGDRQRLLASAGSEAATTVLADRREATRELPGVGPVEIVAARCGDEGQYRLIGARDEQKPFTAGERDFLRGLGQVMVMAMRLARSLRAESEIREDKDFERRTRKQVEARFRTMVERVPAVVYTAEVGPYARWQYVSPRISDLLGYSPEEWLSEPGIWARRLHPDDRDRVLAFERDVAASGSNPTAIDYRMLNRDGEVVWVIDDADLVIDDGGVPLWHGVLFDITDRKEAEQALERLAVQQASLAELGERAIEGADLSRLLSAATKLILGEGATHSFVWERAAHGGDLRLRYGLDRIGGDYSCRISAGFDAHVCAAIQNSRPVMVEDWRVEERFSLPPALRDLGIRSSLAVVIETQDQPYGVLEVHSDLPKNFNLADMHLAQAAANVLASAIERNRADDQLRHRVLHDSLTGLPNRQRFMDLLELALDRAEETETPIAVLFLDLDHFKLINDSLGHHIGDELLRIVAPRLAGRLRPNDTVARFGGDEFGMLVEDISDEDEALAIAERVGRVLARPISIGGMEHFVTASIGVAVADPRSGKKVDAESLVRDADAAMYRAKESGRARHQLFGEEMRADAIRKLETQRKLRHVIESDELTIRYQPVVSLGGGGIVGAEALVRWRHPDRGLLPPQEFIPVAEEGGLIVGIGRWVIEEAMRQAARWHQQNPDSRPVNIAVNVSPRQVVHNDLIETIEEMLEATGLSPELLQLEITESVLVEESVAVTETLSKLDEIGVSLVLDDFGTGYSSLAYLSRFPLDALKIDRSFIERLGPGRDLQGEAIVEAILAMAKALSLQVVAEGVSTVEQARFLREHGCQMAQGYLLSRPIPPDEFSQLLKDPQRIKSSF